MSSDFTTGKNKVITKECSFLMLSDKLGTLFKDYNLDRVTTEPIWTLHQGTCVY
jgi:hypothetical protein